MTKTNDKKKISRSEREAIDSALNTNEFGNYHYSCYRKLGGLDDMLREKCFFTKALACQNDGIEKELHKDRTNIVFPLCFCCSNSEKLPMWLLYGGVDFKGSCASLTSAKMRDFVNKIKNGETRIFASARKNDKIVCNYERQFVINKDIKIVDCGWVHYRKGNDFRCKNQWYTIVDDPNGYERNSFLSKSYIWEYEREFRIVFELIGEYAERVLRGIDKPCGIAIEIPQKIYEQLKITVSPSYKDFSDIHVEKYEGIQRYLLEKIQLSNFAGQLEMDLLKNYCDSCKNKNSDN